ncbi:MAG: RNA polymerase sigma factor [Lentisphaerae bacterium]|nr:RNA polymerase sigma factor [Lentisphaerota bacterium]
MSTDLDILAVEAVRQGDTERYGELVERYQRLVYGIAWSRLGDRSLCDDVSQETFVRGFRFLGALRTPEKYGAWIARIARNTATRMGRKRRRELKQHRQWQLEQPTESAHAAAPSPDGEPVQETLQRVMSELTDPHRESLVLFYLEERSIRDAAHLLGVSESAFKTRLHRARQNLRGKMEARIETLLRGMEPGEDLKSNVLAAVPFVSMLGGGKSLLGGALLSARLGLVIVLSKLPFFLMLGWANWDLARNYREQGDYRKKLTKQNFAKSVPVMVLVMVLAHQGMIRFGPRALNLTMAVLMLPSLLQGMLLLRINRTGYVVAQCVGLSAMWIAFIGMGLFGLSFAWFMFAMLVMNGGLYLTRKSQPRRQDYSLFLRAEHDGLAPGDSRPHGGLHVSKDSMHAFGRFLGNRYLILDHTKRGQDYIFFMPEVRADMLTALLFPLARYSGSSRVIVETNGTCRAWLSPRDRRGLKSVMALHGASPDELTSTVAGAFRSALQRFQAEDESGAERVLQAESEEEIFKQPPHRLSSHRVIYAAALASAGVMILCHFAGQYEWFDFGQIRDQPPKLYSTPGLYRATAHVHAATGRTLDQLSPKEIASLQKRGTHIDMDRPTSVSVTSAEEMRHVVAAETALIHDMACSVITNGADKFHVGMYRDTSIIEITVSCEDPEQAAALCNTIAKRYAAHDEDGVERQLLARAGVPTARD